MINVRIPATTANLGPGFDSLGIALNIYNQVAVELSDKLHIEIKNNIAGLPINEENLVYRSMAHFYRELGTNMPAIRIVQQDSIPISGGLGSSAACIVAGLMIANKLSGENLSKNELLQMAYRLEGHPDNVAPAIFGGMVACAVRSDGHVVFSKISVPSEIAFAVFTPDFHLSTKESRSVLPDRYTREDAIYNISRTALLVASMVNGDWDNLSTAVQDRMHQPHRGNLMPGIKQLFEQAYYHGAKAVFLSGAGPSVVAIIKKEDTQNFMEAPIELGGRSLKILDADNTGVC